MYVFSQSFSEATERVVWIVKNIICLISEQKLEETCEHLLIVTDSESLLRSRCACLEKKQKEDEEKIEVRTPCLNQFSVK